MITEISFTNIILFAVLAASVIIQLYYYLYLFPKVYSFKSTVNQKCTTCFPPISIIIAAKDESENLQKNLRSILNQEYSEFEVIVICDHPTDNSIDILTEFQRSYKNLRIINDIETKPGKKIALTLGINASSHENLVFTDADCQAASKFWLREIASNFSDTKHLILGYGGYYSTKKLLNSFVRYDTAIIAFHYFGSAIVGQAYMGVGRNLAYTKTLWQKAGEFSSHAEIASGDDDLFVISASTKENTAICLNPEAFTYSEAKQTFRDFLNQKSRHISTSTKYNLKSKFISGAEIISRAFFFTSLTLLSLNGFLLIGIILVLFRFLVEFHLQTKMNKTLKTNLSVFYVILFDIFAPFFYSFLVIYKLLIHSNKQW
jgi:cellulose synthase/poly-beta-1,6-N-acetylglucosamine synthase-like glycosyltransferase